MIDAKIKSLENMPANLPPPHPSHIFRSLPWLSNLKPTIISLLQNSSIITQFETGDYLMKVGERPKGIYIIILGLVKVRTEEYSKFLKNNIGTF